MNITNTDRKYINRLFELKPDATGKDVMKLIERLGKWDTRHDLKFEVDLFIKREILKPDIPKDKAIEILSSYIGYFPGYSSDEVYDALNHGIRAIEQTHFIPVEERLPKEHILDDGYVEPSDYALVLGDCKSLGVSRYWGNRRSKETNPDTYKDWMDLDWVGEKVIAWIPIEKPDIKEYLVKNDYDTEEES